MRALAAALGLAGLALATALVVWHGAGAVAEAVLAAGWGLLAVVAFEAVPLSLDSLAWRYLVPARSRPSLARVVRARWIRQSVSQLLPVAQVGGDVVGARMLYLAGVRGEQAGASVVVDLTLGASTQVLYTLCGLSLLAAQYGTNGMALPLLAGMALVACGLAGFVVAQRKGLFRFLAGRAQAFSGSLMALVGSAERLDRAVRAVHHRPADMARNALLQFASWCAGTGETWLACAFLGYPIGLVEAFIVQSLGRAVRSAAFAVPGGLGVQEGGFMLLAGVVGLTPEVGLALSLVKRVRELAIGVPGLIAWQAAEGGRLWRRRRARRPRSAAGESAQ